MSGQREMFARPIGLPLGEAGFAWADALIARALERAGELTEWEADFASGMADRLGRWGARTFCSPAQWDVLLSLEEKLR